MAGTGLRERASEDLSEDELRSYQARLSALAQTTSEYPVECALGAYELLFESREDIQILVDNLSESISREV